MIMEMYSSAHEVPAPAARALSVGSLVDSRGCPVCGKSLKGRQRVCSGACRAKRSREQRAQRQAERDSKVRLHLKAARADVEAALGLLGEADK